MFVDNKTTYLKRDILTRIARLCFEGHLVEEVERLPQQVIPRDAEPYRCCIFKDRAIVKARAVAIMGFSLENEMELDTKLLSDYARLAEERKTGSFPILTFINEACRSCVRANYVVTDVCQNCVAKPCIVNCPKQVIHRRNHRAYIDPEGCINCGKCMQVCPYHAIVFVPVPCEEACPVAAIHKDDTGRQEIDYDKCIFCGKCIRACPFGAVMEKSQIVDVISRMKAGRDVTAMVAPSVVGQYGSSIGQIAGALKKLGFSRVVEVALGADKTIEEESAEFLERMEKGDKFMGTSCCPAYVETVRKHTPAFLPFVSHALTPMAYTAQLVKERFSDSVRVFIGPCVAKKHEDLENKNVDYVLTFEELASMLLAREIVVAECEEAELELGNPTKEGRGFPVSGGVAGALKHGLKERVETILINGFTRKNVKLLDLYATGKMPLNKEEGNNADGFLIEVMSCEGGCMAGPCVIEKPAVGQKRLSDLTATKIVGKEAPPS